MKGRNKVCLQDNPDYEDRVRTLLVDLEEQSKSHLRELNTANENYRQTLIQNAMLQRTVQELKDRLSRVQQADQS